MARLALAAQDSTFILGFIIVAPEAIRLRPLVQDGTFRMFRLPGPAIGRHVPARNHDRVALDRPFLVHNCCVTGRTPLALPSLVRTRPYACDGS
jgi:hypothetical protein